MHNEFTAMIEKDEDWYIGYCPEFAGANGQGASVEECKKNLSDAISLILKDRRNDVVLGVPEGAKEINGEAEWSAFSFSNAMQGMDDEPTSYTLKDLKENFT